MNEVYPVYVVLFSNDSTLGRLIKKTTGQSYIHATISLDSSMNNMYSFSDRPFNHSFFGAGFVRESLWSPMFSHNRFFTILVTFTDKNGINKINSKIESFKQNYTKEKYNDLGLIKYYLNFKDTKDRNETKKQKWFCSEFVSYILKSGGIGNFEDILQSPEDLTRLIPNAISLGDFTISSFNESDLKRRTKVAKKEFLKQKMIPVPEAYSEILNESITPFNFKLQKVNINAEITKYTALLDWKKLYDSFIELFKFSDVELRFSLIELIIRKYFIPLKVSTLNATDKIIEEMVHIHSHIQGRVINFIDIHNSEIYVYINNKIKSLKYPNFFHIDK